MRYRVPILISWIASLAAALAGAYVFVSAIATESLRFGECGTSSLSATDPYCRTGIELLCAAGLLGFVALAFACIAIVVSKRRGKGSNNSFKVMPDGAPQLNR